MKITWYGTASILLESEGERLLFDPFVELAGASNPNSLEDFVQETDICITHGHVDHLFFIPEILEQADATVFATRAVMNTLEGWVEDTGCLVEVEPGYSWRQGNMRITVLKGKHTSFCAKTVFRKLLNPRLLRYFPQCTVSGLGASQIPGKGRNGSLPDRDGG